MESFLIIPALIAIFFVLSFKGRNRRKILFVMLMLMSMFFSFAYAEDARTLAKVRVWNARFIGIARPNVIATLPYNYPVAILERGSDANDWWAKIQWWSKSEKKYKTAYVYHFYISEIMKNDPEEDTKWMSLTRNRLRTEYSNYLEMIKEWTYSDRYSDVLDADNKMVSNRAKWDSYVFYSILDDFSDLTRSIHSRAMALCMMHRFNDALIDANYMIKLRPTNYLTYKFRGYIYYQLKQYNKAKQDFEKALSLTSEAVYYRSIKECIYECEQLLKNPNYKTEHLQWASMYF